MTTEGAVRPQSSVSLQSSNKPAVICPDPSAHAEHERHAKLQETASAAALLVTRDRKELNANPDTKLSSASAAQSLKYAKPQDLPAFPIVGIDASTSAGKAALLAHANPTEVTWWKPGQSESASKAALLAHDYKMAPLWQPEASAAGSKAALLAHSGTKSDSKTHSASTVGSSAAGAALRNQQTAPPVEHGSAEDRKRRALLAATGAYNTSQRRRAESTSVPVASYPDAQNSAQNALSAATLVHRNSVRQPQVAAPVKTSSPALDAARIQNIGKNLPKEMWTDKPPVEIELEEKRHNDALRASAISMAQKMYAVQQSHTNEHSGRNDGLTAATKVHGRTQSTSSQDIKQQAMQFIHVQEAAQRLAAERISKIKGDEANEYRDYYGYGKQPGRSRLSVRRSLHRRASSEGAARGEVDSDDEEQSRRIRSQMSLFNNQLAEVDSRKRQKDRNTLMAAAEKKVHAQMHSMDEKVFNDTGKMTQAMIDEWDAKARERAAIESETRMKNHGKVDIGGGKYMDQSEINAIAAARLQPTLNDISDRAEKQRARDEEIRLDMEEKKREQRIEKDRETELKLAEKRLKDEEKQASKTKKLEEKQAARAEKDAEKARKAEEKRHQKEEKRKSREVSKTSPTIPEATAEPERSSSPPIEGETITTTAAAAILVEDPSSTIAAKDTSPPAKPDAAPRDLTSPEPASPTKRDSGITKFLSKLKRRSKHSSSDETPASPTKPSAFAGGSALTGARSPDDPSARPRARSPSISSLSSSAPSMAAAEPTLPTFSPPTQDKGKRPASATSSVSPSDSVSAVNAEEYAEARDKVHTPELAPPPRFAEESGSLGTGVLRKSASPVKGQTIFREEF